MDYTPYQSSAAQRSAARVRFPCSIVLHFLKGGCRYSFEGVPEGSLGRGLLRLLLHLYAVII
eukprot:scaffold17331_cov66-Phaeocystis_antarctica.AAC.1